MAGPDTEKYGPTKLTSEQKEALDELVAQTQEMMGDHESVLLEAESLVHGRRNVDYGHPLDDFSRTAKMWEAILGTPVGPLQVALCMAAVKISRQCNATKRDNMVDLAGYAETAQWVVDELERRRARGNPV